MGCCHCRPYGRCPCCGHRTYPPYWVRPHYWEPWHWPPKYPYIGDPPAGQCPTITSTARSEALRVVGKIAG